MTYHQYFFKYQKNTSNVFIKNYTKEPRVDAFFRGYGLKTVTCSSYLGGFVGSEAAQSWWLKEKAEGWLSLVEIMSGVSGNLPQTAYVGLQNYLQKKWYIVQCVNLEIGTAFQTVEDTLHNSLLSALFMGATSQILGGAATVLTVTQYGIALTNRTQTTRSNWTASCVITGHLFAALHRTA